jgi:hypothetical protein
MDKETVVWLKKKKWVGVPSFGINNGFNTSFNHWIDIEIRIKYEIENKLHLDWWLDINPMVKKYLGIIVGPKKG